MKKIYYNKLIRDKIPDEIDAWGGECETFRLSKKEFEKELIKKVEEEASGLLAAKNKKELIAELADIMDVIEEILKVKNITTKDLLRQQKKNFEKKGGFAKKLFLNWSSDTGYKTNEKKGKVNIYK